MSAGQPLTNITALGFFTTFVNVGGTGATLALALVLLNSRDTGHRRISRLSLPAQLFQINEPLFFGLPIVLNPVLMAPYVINAVLLTGITFLLMEWGLVGRPVVGIPWTTPPIVGHYLATGGDWRAAVWGAASIAHPTSHEGQMLRTRSTVARRCQWLVRFSNREPVGQTSTQAPHEMQVDSPSGTP
jgi:PTS system cellobiose-specific IIC component